MLKPFLPQLQTTFIKALNDPNRSVRMCAANALQKLIKLHTRVDPLFTELHNGVKNTEDNTIRCIAQNSVNRAVRKTVGEGGVRDGAVVRALASHQCGPGSIPGLGVICGLSLLLVLVLGLRVFFRYSGSVPNYCSALNTLTLK